MALTKDDYRELGRKCAANGKVEAPSLRDGSWQHKAFNEGYEAGKSAAAPAGRAEIQTAPAPVEKPLYHDARTGIIHSHGPWWRADISRMQEIDVVEVCRMARALVTPIVACEHMKLLAAAHNEEHDLRRRLRLQGAVGRVLRRWGRRYGPNPCEPAVPMYRRSASPE